MDLVGRRDYAFGEEEAGGQVQVVGGTLGVVGGWDVAGGDEADGGGRTAVGVPVVADDGADGDFACAKTNERLIGRGEGGLAGEKRVGQGEEEGREEVVRFHGLAGWIMVETDQRMREKSKKSVDGKSPLGGRQGGRGRDGRVFRPCRDSK